MKIFEHRSTHSIDQVNDNNPWAGLASYEDPDKAKRKLKFCGRDDESYDVVKLIMGNIFVTLYGKSGIGKTSLINAGVFPELRENHFTPVSLRLGIKDTNDDRNYQRIIIDSIEQTIDNIETIDVVTEQTDFQAKDLLWNYFVRHRFYSKNGDPTTPVLFFDQFEELFRIKSSRVAVETLLRQIDYINNKDNALYNYEVDGKPYRYETNFRFVVVIREDELYRLEDSIDNCYIPALKRCRYRLRSLTSQGARDVILIPGKNLFKEEEEDKIVHTIIQISRNKEDDSISTNLLSLICNRIYTEFKRNGSEYISLSLVVSFVKGNPFERFFKEVSRNLSFREKSYIVNNFVDSKGHRNSVPESDFMLHVKKSDRLLEGNDRILQRVVTSSDDNSSRVELIHDSFCEPLVEIKKRKAQIRKVIYSSFGIAIALTFVILSTISLIGYYHPSKTCRLLLEEDETVGIDNYWEAEVIILDANEPTDTLYPVQVLNKLRPDTVYKVNDNKRIKVIVHFLAGNFNPIEKNIQMGDDVVIPISRLYGRNVYKGKVLSSVGSGQPLNNAIIMIGSQVVKSNVQGLFTAYVDKNDISNDGTIKIYKSGYKLKEEKLKDKVDTIRLEPEDSKLFDKKLSFIKSKMKNKGFKKQGIIGNGHKSTIEAAVINDSIYGYFYYHKTYDKAEEKEKKHFLILFTGKLNHDKTFHLDCSDDAFNEQELNGKVCNGNTWKGYLHTYSEDLIKFEFK